VKISVPDRRKQPHVVRETNIFTRLQLAGRCINHPRLPNGEIKERVELKLNSYCGFRGFELDEIIYVNFVLINFVNNRIVQMFILIALCLLVV